MTDPKVVPLKAKGESGETPNKDTRHPAAKVLDTIKAESNNLAEAIKDLGLELKDRHNMIKDADDRYEEQRKALEADYLANRNILVEAYDNIAIELQQNRDTAEALNKSMVAVQAVSRNVPSAPKPTAGRKVVRKTVKKG